LPARSRVFCEEFAFANEALVTTSAVAKRVTGRRGGGFTPEDSSPRRPRFVARRPPVP